MKANPTQITPAIPMGAKSNNLQNPTSKIQEDKIDFKTLLENSNLEAQKSRGKQKEDLSDFDTYEDFLEHLHKESQTKEKPSKELNQDNFLKLFVTQLQNQNPLDPKDGAEMASQLAQFNSLEQMVNMNSKLESLEKLTAKGQNNNLTSYIGKEVTINDGRIKLADDKISYLALKTQAPTEHVTIEIRDARNQVVLNEKIGNLSPGDHQIDWDGRNLKGEKLPNGSYSISAYSEQKDGSTQPITTTSRTKIEGINLKESDTFYTKVGKIKKEEISELGIKNFNLERSLRNIKLPLNRLKEQNKAEEKQSSLREEKAEPQKPANIKEETLSAKDPQQKIDHHKQI